MLQTGCIYQSTEGMVRISVMSRHTHNDGTTPDEGITVGSWQFHWPVLGPPPKLVGAYYRQEISWEEFAGQYREYLRHGNEKNSAVKVDGVIQRLIRMARLTPVIILCKEATPERCHRRLIAEYCQELDPRLEVVIG